MLRTIPRLRPLSLLLALLLLTSLQGTIPGSARAQGGAAPSTPLAGAGDPNSASAALQPMQEAYGLLLQRYAVPLDPAQLVDAAQTAMDDALSDAGIAAPPPGLGVLGDDPAQEWMALRQRFQALVAQYGDRVSPQTLAYAAIGGMADSVDDAHTHFITRTPTVTNSSGSRARSATGA